MQYVLEVGARTLDDLLAAERGGADRVELYSSPMEGALTPSAGLIQRSVQSVNTLKVFVMIRPRAGDFLYSENEFETMQRDVEIAVEMGADGIMCGILKSDGRLDIQRMKDLKRRSGNRKFVLHRAFDFSADPPETLTEAVSVGCDYVLTLGQHDNDEIRRAMISKILSKAEGKIKVVLGFGADFDTASELELAIKETGAREYHIVNGYRKRNSKMQKTFNVDNEDDHLNETMYSIEYLSEQAVRECRDILDQN